MAKAVGTKTKQATAIKEAEVLNSVSHLNLDSVSKKITGTQVEVQKSLASLSAQLTEQLQVLQNIEASITLKKDSLKQLYDIEVSFQTLDDLNAQIVSRRQEWDEEQALKQRQFAEQQSERDKQWARAEEEYGYKLAQEHKKTEDGFAHRMLQQERENKDRQDGLEKSWSAREGELKKREQELTDLKTQVANFPEIVKKEVNAAVAIATNSLKKEYETKILLASKDAETAQKLATQEVTSMQGSITKLNTQIEDLRTQLEQAHRDVKEISAKALDSASGRSAMEALQKVMEKEPTYKPSK
jgi:colicin import membrane protein